MDNERRVDYFGLEDRDSRTPIVLQYLVDLSLSIFIPQVPVKGNLRDIEYKEAQLV